MVRFGATIADAELVIAFNAAVAVAVAVATDADVGAPERGR